jgi:hypothetical protein
MSLAFGPSHARWLTFDLSGAGLLLAINGGRTGLHVRLSRRAPGEAFAFIHKPASGQWWMRFGVIEAVASR